MRQNRISDRLLFDTDSLRSYRRFGADHALLQFQCRRLHPVASRPANRATTMGGQKPIGVTARLVAGSQNDLRARVTALFLVVELEFPETNAEKDYPIYNDSSKEPHSHSESKFLRDLLSHQGVVSRPQLKCYCKYLGMPDPPRFPSPEDVEVLQRISSRVCVVEKLVREIIDNHVTRLNQGA